MHSNKSGLFCVYPKNWSLRRKILFNMVAIFLLLSLSEILITRVILLGALKTEFQRKGLSTAKSIAANSVVNVLTQNEKRIKQLLENEERLDKDIAYVFIVDSSGRVLAHTFNNGFPIDLGRVNNAGNRESSSTKILDTQLGIVYDIAVPIVSERSLLGRVHLGVLRNSFQRIVNKINFMFFCTAFFIIIIGIILIYRVVSLIIRPISKLVEATKSIQQGNFSI